MLPYFFQYLEKQIATACEPRNRTRPKDLLETLTHEKLVLDWRRRQSTRASVRYTIETMLDHLPRTYTPELYQKKCDAVDQHFLIHTQGKTTLCDRGRAAPTALALL